MTILRPLSREEQAIILNALGEIPDLDISNLLYLIKKSGITPTPEDIRSILNEIKVEIESLEAQLDKYRHAEKITKSEYDQHMKSLNAFSHDNNNGIYDYDNQMREMEGGDVAALSSFLEPIFAIINDMPADEKNDLLNGMCLDQEFNTNTIKKGLEQAAKHLDENAYSLDDVESPNAVDLVKDVISAIDLSPGISPEEVADIIKEKFHDWPVNYADEG